MKSLVAVVLCVMSVSVAQAAEIAVKCTPPVGDAIKRVNYYYSLTPDILLTKPWFKDTTSDCSITIKNLTAGKSYYIIAKLVGTDGTEGPQSNLITRVAMPGAPVIE